MNPALVSIIVPTYKRTEFLKMTLDSLVAQTYRPIEIWVIDDGSEGEANKQLCAKYRDVHYLKIPNSGGPAKPRNIGIQKANGEFIAFVDDDDLWVTDKLERQLLEFSNDKGVGLVHSCCQVIDEDGNLTDLIIGRPGDKSVKSGNVSMRMIGNWTLMTSTVIARASVLEKVGYFNEAMPPFGEDMEYWVRCSFITEFSYIDQPLVSYRKHNGTRVRWKRQYGEVPSYLMRTIQSLKNQGTISAEDYPKLKNQVVRMQLKRLKPGFWKNLSRVFNWNPFWFLNFGNMRVFLKQLFKAGRQISYANRN